MNNILSSLLRFGDDAAEVHFSENRSVISIDTITQDVDFRLLWPNGYVHTPEDIGWKSAAQNLSDVNAMGAIPVALVSSIGVSPGKGEEWVFRISQGTQDAIDALGAWRCRLVGGDIGQSKEITVTGAVLGDLEGWPAVGRDGAKAGDVLAVGGTLGEAAAGLALLESSDITFDRLGKALTGLVEAQIRPRPPLNLGPLAARAGCHAMLDISDGLVKDANRMARSSGVRINLESERLSAFTVKLEPAARLLGQQAQNWVMGGGEDFSLLAAFPPGQALPEGFIEVGSVGALPDAPNADTTDATDASRVADTTDTTGTQESGVGKGLAEGQKSTPEMTHAVTLDGNPFSGEVGFSHFSID